MLKFRGTDTSKKIHYEAEAETPIKLYEQLVLKGIISVVDGDPYELAVLDKQGKATNDFRTDDDEFDEDGYQDAVGDVRYQLSDEEILDLIGMQTGNAYYQKITDTAIAETIARVMDLDPESVQDDINHGYIGVFDGDNGKDYAWYCYNDYEEWVVDLEAGKEIRKDKFLEVCEIARTIEDDVVEFGGLK